MRGARWLLLAALLSLNLVAPATATSPSPPPSPSPSPGLPLTLGIKHVSDFEERRRTLTTLITSVRDQYPLLPILVAYEGAYHYEPAFGASNEEYIRCTAKGLSVGRNTIVAHVQTEFVMIVDDDVEFHRGTRLGTLVAHLQHDPALGLVAACYYPSDCYAYNLKLDATHVRVEEVSPVAGELVGPIRAEVVHNCFVARTAVLQSHPWDSRQQLMEHETFFAALASSGIAVGYDPRVTLYHHQQHNDAEYFVQR